MYQIRVDSSLMYGKVYLGASVVVAYNNDGYLRDAYG